MSDLAIIIIQTVTISYIDSYVCKHIGKYYDKQVWANIIDPAEFDQGLYYLQFSLSPPQTVKQSFTTFWSDFQDFYDV